MIRTISDEMIQEIVKYLGTKPYSEVYKIVPALLKLECVDSYVKRHSEEYKNLLKGDEDE